MHDSAPTNLEEGPYGLMTKIIKYIKPKGRKQYTSFFLQCQILKVQERINGDN